MKKIFAIIMAFLLIATVFSIPVFAEESAIVMKVYGQKKDGTRVLLDANSEFDDCWNLAMERAIDHDWMSGKGYVRISVDLLADWHANSDGEFSEDGGYGFKWDTILVDEEARITLNLNGHTIDRGLTEWEYNGEVIYVDDEADFILNGGKDAADTTTGTIKGGFSGNGAGGIHIMDDANVTLNNVNLIGNKIEDDSGSAIAVYDGAKLTMNGGCISENFITSVAYGFDSSEATVFVDDATATLNGVTFSNNICHKTGREGGAVFVDGDGEVTLNDCIAKDYGQEVDAEKEIWGAKNLFYVEDSDGKMTLNRCTITNNNLGNAVFEGAGSFDIKDCTVTNNTVSSGVIFWLGRDYEGHYAVMNSTFENNKAAINTVWVPDETCTMTFINCVFKNNVCGNRKTFYGHEDLGMRITDCELNDSTFANKQYIGFSGTNAGVGSIFGEGSLVMIVALLAFLASIASICTTIILNKKKTASAAVNNVAETEDEE